MKALLDILKSFVLKHKVNLIVLLLAFVVVWFVLPLIPISGTHPFANTWVKAVLLVIVLILLSLKPILQFLQKNLQGKSVKELLAKLKQWRQTVGRHSSSAFKAGSERLVDFKHRLSQEHKNRQLRRLPWYLVLGPPKSGKKTAILNSGLHFARPESFGEEAIKYMNMAPDFGWWFSNKAVLVEATTRSDEEGKQGWRQFIRILKRERKNKPLNGIVLSLPVVQLLTMTNNERQTLIQEVCYYIREIHHQFKSLVPVYLVLNQCDLVAGFMEFFSDLSKEELSQVWGVTLPMGQCHDLQFVKSFVDREYTALIQQLKKRVMWVLDIERSERGRELIYTFPQQMQLFRRPLETFIAELFGATRYPKALQFRGVYFVSGAQGEGEVNDFVLRAMSKKFQLHSPVFKSTPRLGECYFLRNLFPMVIAPEASLLGDSERRRKIKKFSYNLAIAACPTLIVLAGFSFYNGYKTNKKMLSEVNDQIAQYQLVFRQNDAKSDKLLPLLPAFNSLYNAYTLYRDSDSFGVKLLYESGAIQRRIHAALSRALQAQFLPRVASQLEGNLNGNIPDPNLLYATLKGYLAFNSASNVGVDAVKVPMFTAWNQLATSNPTQATQIKRYLDFALSDGIHKLPLDYDLINQIRNRLAKIVPSDRAYGLLKLRASVSNYPNLLIQATVGSSFSELFTTQNAKGKNPLEIPVLYTHTGYQQIFNNEQSAIAKEVANDNRDIGLVNESDTKQSANQISRIMANTYSGQYIQHWDRALDSLQVRSFDNLKDAIKTLSVLTGTNSPMAKLLHLVSANTSVVDNDQMKVVQHYQMINNYTNGDSEASWQATSEALSKIKAFFEKLQSAQDPAKASYEVVLKTLVKKESPLADLSKQAAMSKGVVKGWLEQLTRNCWNILIQEAHQYMNQAWSKEVMVPYNSEVRGRYPVYRRGQSQVAIDNFNSFFGNGGVIDKYYQKYLAPFINTDGKEWKPVDLHGLNIELSKHDIAVFYAAQKIREELFANNAKKASFSFSIKPLLLDKRAASVRMTFGSNQLTYSNGPQNTVDVNWPLAAGNDDSAMVITDFNSNQMAHTASGPWSVFKILSHGYFHSLGQAGTYTYHVNMRGYRATFRITGVTNVNVFKLAYLSGLRLPEKLGERSS